MHIFSGLLEDGEDMNTESGIGIWCRFNDSSGNYETDGELSYLIDTPNYSNNGSIGGLLDLNNQQCGSAPIQSASNTQIQGPCNGGPTNFPVNLSRFSLGAVNLATYISAGIYAFDATGWENASAGVGYRGGGNPLTKSKLPGQCIASTDFYNVIVPSNTDLGVAVGDSLGRVHWDVATGTLGQFVTKILGIKIGKIGGAGIGIMSPGMADELAAGLMLVSGYGILLNDELAFADAPTP